MRKSQMIRQYCNMFFILDYLQLNAFCGLVFYHPLFSPFFKYVLSLFFVSSLAYPNLLGTKRLGCCSCCDMLLNYMFKDPCRMLIKHITNNIPGASKKVCI
jgi:hypothetical protein